MEQEDRGKLPARGMSILVRIVGIFFASTTIVVGVLSFQFLQTVEKTAVKTIEEAGREATLLEADQISGAVKFRKVEDIEARLGKMVEIEGDRHVQTWVFDTEGNILTQLGDGAEAMQDNVLSEALSVADSGEAILDREGLRITAPVRDRSGQLVGVVSTIRTADTAIATARREILVELAMAFAIFLGLMVGTGFLLRQWISRPVVALEQRTRSMADGDLSGTVPGTERRDEIGQTSRALEILREKLEAAERSSRDAIIAGAGFSSSSAPLLLADTDFLVIQKNEALVAECTTCLGRLLDKDRRVPSDVLHRLPDIDLAAIVSRGLPAKLDFEFDGRTMSMGINQIDQDGSVIGYVIELKDVTRTRNEAATFAALDSSMLRASFDAKGEKLAANDRFSALIGKDAIAALSIRDRLTSSEDGHSLLESAASGATFTGEMRLDELTLSGAFAPISDQDGKTTGYVLLASDVTQDRAFAAQAEAQRKTAEENQAEIVTRLTTALQELADGDLTTRLEQKFKGGHDNLRLDFNSALTALDQTIVQVLDKAISIKGETDNISNAASDLSKRTEQQAATLEQFAAALTEITQSVASAAEGASQADEAVTAARKNAETSGEVVKQAVSAMSEIATSSEQISKIIGVIDDIAFQTNLLALNAGVEAARAGDAGRGFAVVASEVRALAQRSSEAAREINELISASGGQVKRGVSLVDKTGTALKDIVLSVREISDLVANIATSAREQSNGLSEINGAMAQLDQVTQQNAAMFEETSAATRMLSEEADNLTATTSKFTTSGASSLPAQNRPAHRSEWEEQETRAISTKAQSTSSQGTAAVAIEEDDWDEF